MPEGGEAMSRTVKIDRLADTVMKGLMEYKDLAADVLKTDVSKASILTIKNFFK